MVMVNTSLELKEFIMVLFIKIVHDFSGFWKNSKFNGMGRYISPDDDVYEGDFKDGFKDGYGVIKFKNGGSYEGEWKEDKQHGKGTLIG